MNLRKARLEGKNLVGPEAVKHNQCCWRNIHILILLNENQMHAIYDIAHNSMRVSEPPCMTHGSSVECDTLFCIAGRFVVYISLVPSIPIVLFLEP